MASQWSRGLLRVDVPKRQTPKPVTFVYPYYMNRHFFRQQIAGWWQYPEEFRSLITVIVVDDGSPEPAQLPDARPFRMRLFRIHEDRPWNWLAARNIGAFHADNGWILLTDMDHVVPPITATSLIWDEHDPRVVYAFSRREHTGGILSPHSASFFMTRDMFWLIGGYDESLSGHYGTDGEFRRRIVKHAPIHVLPKDVLMRYEYVEDSSTARYRRKLPEDAAAVKQIVSSRPKEWTPKVLSFPYEELTC